jgi:hypothetical protein
VRNHLRPGRRLGEAAPPVALEEQGVMMHFHVEALCRDCKHVIEFSTPIPDRIVLNHQCVGCGGFRVIGLHDGRICSTCRETLILDWDEVNV